MNGSEISDAPIDAATLIRFARTLRPRAARIALSSAAYHSRDERPEPARHEDPDTAIHRRTDVGALSAHLSLNAPPLAKLPREPTQRVELGFQDDAAATAQRVRDRHRNVRVDVLRQIEEPERPRHALGPRPDQVAMDVVQREVALGSSGRRAYVGYDRVRHVTAAPPGQPDLERQVAVLVIGEEVFVEPARVHVGVATVE